MNLIEQTAPDGAKFLVASADGTRLLTDQDCEGCCGNEPCARAYVYFPCPPPFINGSGAGEVPPECSQNFPNIRVCSDAVCNGRPIRDLLKIMVGGRCYSRPPDTQPIATATDETGFPLYDSADISCSHVWADCSDPVCVEAYGRTFVRGIPCAGQNYFGPPIFFLACAVLACDVVNVPVPGHQGGAFDNGVCVYVAPGTTYREANLPPDAIKLVSRIDGRYGGKCCSCLITCSEGISSVSGCNGTGPATSTTLHCCCSALRTIRGTVSSLTTYDSSLGSLISRTVSGSGVWQYNDAGILFNQIGGSYTVTERFSNSPDQVQTFPMDPWQGCGFDGVPSAFPFGPPFGGVEQCNPSSYSDSGNLVGGVTNRLVVCKNAQLGGSWTLTNRISGVVSIRANSSSVWSAQYDGRCSGQCGGGLNETKAKRTVKALEENPLASLPGCASCGDAATGGLVI
jgi:hypothetical protein